MVGPALSQLLAGSLEKMLGEVGPLLPALCADQVEQFLVLRNGPSAFGISVRNFRFCAFEGLLSASLLFYLEGCLKVGWAIQRFQRASQRVILKKTRLFIKEKRG